MSTIQKCERCGGTGYRGGTVYAPISKCSACGGTGDIEIDCVECGGICCQGIIDVYHVDEIFYDDALTEEDPNKKYDRVMKMVDGRCIALKNGRCTIYLKRPTVCRDFQVGSSCCENYRRGYLNSHSCQICPLSEKLAHLKL